jgi:hypothetical protein
VSIELRADTEQSSRKQVKPPPHRVIHCYVQRFPLAGGPDDTAPQDAVAIAVGGLFIAVAHLPAPGKRLRVQHELPGGDVDDVLRRPPGRGREIRHGHGPVRQRPSAARLVSNLTRGGHRPLRAWWRAAKSTDEAGSASNTPPAYGCGHTRSGVDDAVGPMPLRHNSAKASLPLRPVRQGSWSCPAGASPPVHQRRRSRVVLEYRKLAQPCQRTTRHLHSALGYQPPVETRRTRQKHMTTAVQAKGALQTVPTPISHSSATCRTNRCVET